MTDAPNAATQQKTLPTSFALISLCPIFIFCLAEFVLAALAQNAVTYSSTALKGNHFPEVGEAAARMHMLGLGLLVLIGAVGMVLKTIFDLRANFTVADRSTLVLAGALPLAIGAIFLLAMQSSPLMQPDARLGHALFHGIFDGLKEKEEPGIWNRCTYLFFVRATHVAIFLAVAAMISGSISCLARFPDLGDEDNLTLQSRRLRSYAITSAAFLVIGVFYFRSWAIYPSFLLATETAQAQFLALSNNYTSFAGIEYTLILAAYVLPVSYIQSHRIERMKTKRVVGSEENGAEQPAAEHTDRVKNGERKWDPEFASLDMLKIILAIISPLVTGTLTNLFTAIG